MNIICHDGAPHSSGLKIEYVRSHRPYRTCSYCGSIHPEDLLSCLASGFRMESADWKYGWPHKFYIRPPYHPDQFSDPESKSMIGDMYDSDFKLWKDDIVPESLFEVPTVSLGLIKFYSEHFIDYRSDTEALNKLAGEIYLKTRIHFFKNERGLAYSVDIKPVVN